MSLKIGDTIVQNILITDKNPPVVRAIQKSGSLDPIFWGGNAYKSIATDIVSRAGTSSSGVFKFCDSSDAGIPASVVKVTFTSTSSVNDFTIRFNAALDLNSSFSSTIGTNPLLNFEFTKSGVSTIATVTSRKNIGSTAIHSGTWNMGSGGTLTTWLYIPTNTGSDANDFGLWAKAYYTSSQNTVLLSPADAAGAKCNLSTFSNTNPIFYIRGYTATLGTNKPKIRIDIGHSFANSVQLIEQYPSDFAIDLLSAAQSNVLGQVDYPTF